MDQPTIALAIALVVVVAAAVWLVVRNQRSQRLKARFGSEYDRTVQSAGARPAAEADLLARAKRVATFDIRPLSPGDRDRFAELWRQTQAAFVDDPAGAVARAEALLEEVMQARGYPVADFERRADDVSVDHPRFVQSYREAHAIALASRRGSARTEDLRRATIHYRDLFEDLLDSAGREEVRR
jgi:hypothetical protein